MVLSRGHYAWDCKVPQCQGCRKALLRRTCETDEEEMEMELIKEKYLKLKEAVPLQWIKSIEDKETGNEKPEIFFLKEMMNRFLSMAVFLKCFMFAYVILYF